MASNPINSRQELIDTINQESSFTGFNHALIAFFFGNGTSAQALASIIFTACAALLENSGASDMVQSRISILANLLWTTAVNPIFPALLDRIALLMVHLFNIPADLPDPSLFATTTFGRVWQILLQRAKIKLRQGDKAKTKKTLQALTSVPFGLGLWNELHGVVVPLWRDRSSENRFNDVRITSTEQQYISLNQLMASYAAQNFVFNRYLSTQIGNSLGVGRTPSPNQDSSSSQDSSSTQGSSAHKISPADAGDENAPGNHTTPESSSHSSHATHPTVLDYDFGSRGYYDVVDCFTPLSYLEDNFELSRNRADNPDVDVPASAAWLTKAGSVIYDCCRARSVYSYNFSAPLS